MEINDANEPNIQPPHAKVNTNEMTLEVSRRTEIAPENGVGNITHHKGQRMCEMWVVTSSITDLIPLMVTMQLVSTTWKIALIAIYMFSMKTLYEFIVLHVTIKGYDSQLHAYIFMHKDNILGPGKLNNMSEDS